LQYLKDNGARLGIGVCPGIKMFTGDEHDRNFDPRVEIGEARHLVAPTLAIAYSRAVLDSVKEWEFKRDDAEIYLNLALSWFRKTLKVIRHCGGYPVDFFIPTDPSMVKPEDNPWPEIDPNENVVYIPGKQSSLENRSEIVWAAVETAYAIQEYKRIRALWEGF
jgi:hypothetical protein